MKSIEEAAKEYAAKRWVNDGRPETKTDFIAGVEFAQTWIPVGRELPEDNFMEYGLQFGYELLVKCPNNKAYIANRVYSEDHNDFVWRYLDGGKIYCVTHWRPIELK